MNPKLSLLDQFRYAPKDADTHSSLTLSAKRIKVCNSDTGGTSPSDGQRKKPLPATIGSLPPICPFDNTANIFSLLLILGSCPSAESLRRQEYYAHKQNHFWPMMSELLETPIAQLSYQKRVETLLNHRICVWDVLAGCSREGSSDSSITHAVPNDFSVFFSKRVFSKIRWIICNGQTAYKLFVQHCMRFVPGSVEFVKVLPSTSPANARADAVKSKARDWKDSGVKWDLLKLAADGERFACEGAAISSEDSNSYQVPPSLSRC